MIDNAYGINKSQLGSDIGTISLHLPSFATDHERKIINQAVVCMSNLLNTGYTSFPEFIDKIVDRYDTTNDPRMNETIQVLNAMQAA
ncbi:hypothetical protein [Vibrio owensii]|uniref:hypothetical protein n=1 Tax=Vibrio owensii TaxID=696485 RepID=UPI0018F16183|nr:hypothetical protein [Vibrio owensii]